MAASGTSRYSPLEAEALVGPTVALVSPRPPRALWVTLRLRERLAAAAATGTVLRHVAPGARIGFWGEAASHPTVD